MQTVAKAHALFVVGARPNFMKVAPVLRILRRDGGLKATLVHTGQHYDPGMSGRFFDELEIPPPDHSLDVGSASHAVQTARVMERIEPVLLDEKPDVVVVAGDVNSTLAAALVAVKLHIRVAHIEAGLRSLDRRMPEEINRVLVDQIADVLYTTERKAHANLAREGIAEDRIVFVGNLMIDTLLASVDKAVSMDKQIARRFGAAAVSGLGARYALLTLHRPSNVDEPAVLSAILNAVGAVAQEIPVLFPMHPRTATRIAALPDGEAALAGGIWRLPPVSYLEMVGLMKEATLVLTDSGGVQEETTALGIPCLTLRENTERPITVDEGTNIIVGANPARIVEEVRRILGGRLKGGRVPEGWDGVASQRVVTHLERWLRDAHRRRM